MKKFIAILMVAVLSGALAIPASAAASITGLTIVNAHGNELFTNILPSDGTGATGKLCYSGEKVVAAKATINASGGVNYVLELNYYEDGVLKQTVESSTVNSGAGAVAVTTDYLAIDRDPSVHISKCILEAKVVPSGGGAAVAEVATRGVGQHDIIQSMIPFYRSTVIYNESVMMTEPVGGGAPEGRLAFEPLEILSVKNAQLDYEFVAGLDYEIADGKLRLLPNEYRADSLTQAQMYPTIAFHNVNAWAGKGGRRFVIWDEGIWRKQLAVTYTRAAESMWHGSEYSPSATVLPKTQAILAGGSPLKIVVFGDSISAGGNASRSTAPYLPNYANLFARTLMNNFASTVTVQNESIGGTTASVMRGTGEAAVAARGRVKAASPDLIIIGFGANDASGGFDKAKFKDDITFLINDLKATNTEFILLASTVANPESVNVSNDGLFPQYAEALAEIQAARTDVAAVDMTGTHLALMNAHGKLFIDITGSNVNHPNDYLTRWIAQHMSSLFID